MIYHRFSGDWGYFPNKQKHTVVTRMPCLPLYFNIDTYNYKSTLILLKFKKKNAAKPHWLQRFSFHI